MHNNYYFLRQLSHQLSHTIVGWQLAVSFSQNKDELILGFFNPANPSEEFYIKAYLDPKFCCLHFPKELKRSRKNNVDLFKMLIGKEVTHIHQFQNERSFAIHFNGDAEASVYKLLFKMHGNRSNVLFFKEDQLIELFKNNLKNDEDLKLNNLERIIDTSYEKFVDKQGNLQALYPTFGSLVRNYLFQKGYAELPLNEKWKLLQDTLRQLENPKQYFIVQWQNELQLSLLKMGDIVVKHTKPITAIQDFFLQYIRDYHLTHEKNEIVKALNKKKSQAENYIHKSQQKLTELLQGTKPDEIANIIMANLHQIPLHATQVELFNFYNNQPITIKLKKDLNPQKNAEVYYRKAKNQKLETEQLEHNINQKKEQLKIIEQHLFHLLPMNDLKELRQYTKGHQLRDEKQQSKQELPYRQFEIEGFTVLVGKNAKSNDILIRNYSWKEDLWLHAKDVSGSHVIIKHQAGKTYPKPVIEKAAQLAAYYSKRKMETLCPVSITPRKYVRKSKDLAPGQVIVDREETLLVEPQLIIS